MEGVEGGARTPVGGMGVVHQAESARGESPPIGAGGVAGGEGQEEVAAEVGGVGFFVHGGVVLAGVKCFVGGIDGGPHAGAEDGPVDFGDDEAVVGHAEGAGGCAEEGAFADGVEGALGVFGGAAPVHVEVLGEGVEGEVARQDVEERAEGVGFEINAGGAGDFGVGVFNQGGADGLEEVEVFAEIPHAPFGAVDGVADFKEVGEGVGAVEGEGDHLTPSFGFADGAAVLDEGDGDAVALPVEEEGLVQRPLPGFQIFVVIEAEEERDFLRALQLGEEVQLPRPGGGFGFQRDADGVIHGDGGLEGLGEEAFVIPADGAAVFGG